MERSLIRRPIGRRAVAPTPRNPLRTIAGAFTPKPWFVDEMGRYYRERRRGLR
ncbi:hypothetical protein [Halalkalicoccus ordinarius]|uniref:hypothetical protein n=1 Tax=Halalkalicoccus ordinarius TaxID=3116651 RepID=UPI00300EF502